MKNSPRIDCLGTVRWYKEGTEILHREDGPAIEYVDGHKLWFQNGELHRINGPAEEFVNGDRIWFYHNQRHRIDGPAVELFYGKKLYKKLYYLYGKYYPNINSDKEWIIFQIIN